MSLYWPTEEEQVCSTAPRLHAFIIGVASYPHLPGGTGKPTSNPLLLRQISTPQYTASRMARWFESEYRNPSVPLGSIELLVSEAPAEQMRAARPRATGNTKASVLKADRATLANIREAFKRWQRRASSHPENIAVFYFCGHGILKAHSHFLLAEDWGDPSHEDAWENTIDFDGMRQGMRSCAAGTQLFFVDACRETPESALKEIPRGHRFISATETEPSAAFAVFNAAADQQQAFGPSDGPSYFCEAVIAALRVGAEHRTDGVWIVDSFSLGNAIGKVLSKYKQRFKNQRLSCSPQISGEPADIQHLTEGSVLAVVGCTSAHANQVAEIVLSNGSISRRSGVGAPKPMYEVVEEGVWDIEVNFPDGHYPSQKISGQRLRPLVFEGVAIP